MEINPPAPGSLERVESPGLLIFPDRIQHNINRMIKTVGGKTHVDRLRPHVKTHKMSQVTKLQVASGITRFKASTLCELEMTISAGATDVLLAHQLVGPKIARFVDLCRMIRNVKLSAIVDSADAIDLLVAEMAGLPKPVPLFIDVDCGMHRTGIPIGPELDELRGKIDSHREITFGGLHVYDGHVHDPGLETRKRKAKSIIDSVRSYVEKNPCPSVVGGGSPTFEIWASETSWECSPGTTLLWDMGYGQAFPDLSYEVAAALVTRVISKPSGNYVCLDLGHKAVAAEMMLLKRVFFPAIADLKLVAQSEEHLVVETSEADRIKIGDVLVGYPKHVCPTIALHAQATVVRDGHATDELWSVDARDR